MNREINLFVGMLSFFSLAAMTEAEAQRQRTTSGGH